MIDIKFRAYDEDKQEMVYDFWDTPYFLHRVICHYNIDKCMQYIGRKDIDNKDIYVGDIIENEMNMIGIVVFCDNLNWDGGGSLHSGYYVKEWMEHGYEGGLSYHDGFDNCKVLGNIYQNSKLLEKSK